MQARRIHIYAKGVTTQATHRSSKNNNIQLEFVKVRITKYNYNFNKICLGSLRERTKVIPYLR